MVEVVAVEGESLLDAISGKVEEGALGIVGRRRKNKRGFYRLDGREALADARRHSGER